MSRRRALPSARRASCSSGRTHPGKEDTFVLDFVNTAEQMREQFAPFYETTWTEETDPNLLYDLATRIDEHHILDPDEQARAIAALLAVRPDDGGARDRAVGRHRPGRHRAAISPSHSQACQECRLLHRLAEPPTPADRGTGPCVTRRASGHRPGMARSISDDVVVDVLRRVDRLAAPLVRRLGRPPELPQAERAAWWADRASRVAAGASAVPRFAGKLADLLPLENTVGAAAQSVVVLGVAGEHGVSDPAERVSLLARVLLGRDLPPERVRPLLAHASGTYRQEALGAKDSRGPVRTVWRLARLLGRIDDALDVRPKGKLRHRALSNLPVVGIAGGYAAEREGLRRAAAQAATMLADPT